MDTIDATLSRILFFEPSKFSPSGAKFLIGKTTSGGIVKGELAKPVEGERYRLYGEWVASKGRAEPAFAFTEHEILIDESVPGVIQYLKNYVPGLGVVKATAIVEVFGADALKVLRTDAKAALAVHGITAEIVASIEKHFRDDVKFDPVAYGKLVDLFANHRFPRKVVKALLRDWGSDAPTKVTENPYMLLAYPRMGWKGVDAFALDPAGAAYDPAGLARQVAAIVEGLERLSDDGHTYGTRVEVEAKAFELIGQRPEDLAWNVATIDGLVARLNDEDAAPAGPDGLPSWLADDRPDDADEAFALPKLAAAERSIAGHLARLMGGGKPLGFSLASDGLSAEQRAAVKVIEANSVSILAGPPGTGKSYTLAAVIARLVAHKVGTIRVVAPTGKASKRAAELIDAAVPGHGIECTTIHRALGVAKSEDAEGVPSSGAKVGRGRDEFGFQKGEGDPLEVDFLVVDECFPAGTMVDTVMGKRDISSIRANQMILNAAGVDHVVAVAQREVQRVARITVAGQVIEASEGHPFFTRRGLVRAADLEPGDVILQTLEAMRLLRYYDPHYRALLAETVLLSRVQRSLVDAIPAVQGQNSQHGDVAKEWRRAAQVAGVRSSESAGRDGTYKVAQPGRTTGSSGQDISASTRDGTSSAGARWERPRPVRTGSQIDGGAPGMGTVDRADADGTRPGLSDALQAGPRTTRPIDRDRAGREFALRDRSQGEGSQEDRLPGFSRVDRVEVLEQGDPRLDRLRDADGKLYFYDLQAARHQSFSVNGLLVHNCSMVDARLMSSLLSALATGTRVVFVGDPNQLPSVGPGSVLRDLLAAGVPAATLSTIQRSDGGGRVVRACHSIKDGVVPKHAPRVALPTDNWVHIEEDDPARIAARIVEMHESARRNGRYDPLWDMQVVSAQKKGHAFACEPLNAMLGRLLNPGAYTTEQGGEDDDEGFGPPFRVGDKVIRKKNGACDEMRPLRGADPDARIPISKYDYEFDPDPPREDWRWRDPRDGPSARPRGYSLSETTVVNGDMGQVLDIVAGDGEAFAVVQFRTPERLCRLPMGEHHIIPAYALTCHSVQGSGFPYVIVPVHHAFYWDNRTSTGLWNKELVYTAVSRAEKLLVTVGQFSAIRAAIGRPTIGHRRTRLAGYVRDAIARGGPGVAR